MLDYFNLALEYINDLRTHAMLTRNCFDIKPEVLETICTMFRMDFPAIKPLNDCGQWTGVHIADYCNIILESEGFDVDYFNI